MGKCKKYFKRGVAMAVTAAMVIGSETVAFADEPSALPAKKDLVVYFANWDVYNSDYGTVANIPWDKVTYINHAFWQITPKDGAYVIESTDAWADLGADPATGEVSEEQAAKSHFKAYETYSAEYPDVNIMISVGGWTRCGYFSEMAATAEGRESFIDSCIDTMETYSWVDGIDIDWEYPGVARESEGGSDQGCPVVSDDYNNYTLLIKEMREAFDAKFGTGAKKLTTCSSVNINTISKQDVAAIAPYLDLINVMSYDMTGSYDPVTGHQSALYSTDDSKHSVEKGVNYFLDKGVEASKINIGSPLYCHSWTGVTPDGDGNVVGVAANGGAKTESWVWNKVKALELKAVDEGEGWHKGYDNVAKAAYLYNDNPNSMYNGEFLSYENEASLDAKISYIYEKGLAGLIVWECGGDAAWDNHPMLTQMSKGLNIYSGEQTVYGSAGMIPEIEDTVSDSGYPDPILEVTAGDGTTLYPKGTYIYFNGAVWKSINDNSSNFDGNLPGGTWGDSCWEKAFDVKEYVSQEENGGQWAWETDGNEYFFYDPDKDNVGGIYYAKAQTSNTANDAPDGEWGTNWEYVTTLKRGDAVNASDIADPIKEVKLGDGSVGFPKGAFIFFNGAVWKSINDNSNDFEGNMPGGTWADSCWEKVFDVKDYVSQEEKGYWDWAADEGDYVFYDPDKDGTGGIYYAKAQTSNTANDAPDGIWGTNWEYVTTVVKIVEPAGGDDTTGEDQTGGDDKTGGNTGSDKKVKKPGKAVVSKASKQGKKLKITLKSKVKKADGYQVKVYTSKKKAKSNKGAVVTKLIKKNIKKITVKSSKLNKKKTLFVKIRAYRKSGKTKKYGSWSKTESVKIK